MNRDLSAILNEWEYRPGHLSARIISGGDGEPRVQVRLDLGILQMGVEGRPDGLMPYGFLSLLDYYETMFERIEMVQSGERGDPEGDESDFTASDPDFSASASSSGADERESRSRKQSDDESDESNEAREGETESQDASQEQSQAGTSPAEDGEGGSNYGPSVPPGWPAPRDEMGDDRPLSSEECRLLREEVSQFNQRAVALIALEEYVRVFRDAKRNLRVIDVCKVRAASDNDKHALEQFRPYFIAMMHRALALSLIRDGEQRAALLAVDDGLDMLKACFADAGKAKMMENSMEFQTLKEMRDSLAPKLPISQRAELKQRLARAVEEENYKLAAILRDELKQLSDDSGA
jgi:hypothetical protein